MTNLKNEKSSHWVILRYERVGSAKQLLNIIDYFSYESKSVCVPCDIRGVARMNYVCYRIKKYAAIL